MGRHSRIQCPREQSLGDLRLGPERDALGHAGLPQPLVVPGPFLGQVEFPIATREPEIPERQHAEREAHEDRLAAVELGMGRPAGIVDVGPVPVRDERANDLGDGHNGDERFDAHPRLHATVLLLIVDRPSLRISSSPPVTTAPSMASCRTGCNSR